MRKKTLPTKFWILLIAAVLALSIAAALLIPRLSSGGTIANVYLDGECIYSVDLSTVTAPTSFPVEGAACTNVIEVAPGKIRVAEATCPDQVCVHTGWIDAGVTPVVCLPNHLVIRIEGAPGTGGGAEIDAVTK